MPLIHRVASTISANFDRRDVLQLSVMLFIVIFFLLFPLSLNGWLSRLENAGARLAHRKRLGMLSIAVGVMAIRLAALPWMPVPVARVHDEFSYLLAGDTFAHRRLANPPHPMWVFFDTVHVNQHPTYMSKYPPGQGMALAFGQVIGNPWIGVLLSCAGMCVAIFWALAGWLPASWALLGATLFAFHVGIFSYWMNSYWGGAVAALGGALVIGAFPRIVGSWKIGDVGLLGAGAFILAISRPFEGLIFCAPVVVALAIAAWRQRGKHWPTTTWKVAACLSVTAILLGAFECYYDFRGTGHALVSPYTINGQTYMITPNFFWQRPRPPFRHTSPQLDDFYNRWALESWQQGRATNSMGFVGITLRNVARLAYFCMWPELALLLPTLFLIFRYRPFRFLLLQLGICIVGFSLVPWFQPHYAAPAAVTLFILLTQALRMLRHVSYGGRPIGVGLSRAAVILVAAFAPAHHPYPPDTSAAMLYRWRFAAQLASAPGKDLVIVSYGRRHDPLDEWVYNAADIDHAKVVWARQIPGVDLQPLLNYFRGRRVWLAEPDAAPPCLIPFEGSSAPP